MKTYLAIEPPNGEPEDTRFVRDGFSFLALVSPVLFALRYRLWLSAAGFAVLALALTVLGQMTDRQGTAFVIGLLFNLGIALEAGVIVAFARERAGWRTVNILLAPDLDSAEAMHFAGIEASPISSGDSPQPIPVRSTGAVPHAFPPRGETGPILGLFGLNRRLDRS
ncbi:DUF2628 domain-containing protein [Pararhizobium mangrovi]|uniref:DUF2628 domain-containing protein n=1 Tax=Pararhizobium mangrovi TaxID=2590452 RepID=A0A506TYU9_9HYPH|nr:DUF2628 domain-containing protein [Pararhizobium mangrovi]TPW27252.1 DUF2628 domain-containing protein [Pararhizobium mangrovi]